MIEKEKINDWLQPLLEEGNLFLVEIKVKPGNCFDIFIDSDKGVAISECAKVSRALANKIQEETEDYELNVSSPGLDQPLKVLPQYRKNIGRKVEVLLKTGVKQEGELRDVDEECILICFTKKEKKEGSKKKELVEYNEKIAFVDIKATKIVVTM